MAPRARCSATCRVAEQCTEKRHLCMFGFTTGPTTLPGRDDRAHQYSLARAPLDALRGHVGAREKVCRAHSG